MSDDDMPAVREYASTREPWFESARNAWVVRHQLNSLGRNLTVAAALTRAFELGFHTDTWMTPPPDPWVGDWWPGCGRPMR